LGDGRTVALAEEGAQAFEGGADRVLARELERTPDVGADARRQGLDGRFHDVGFVDAVGNRGGDLLRLLGADQRLRKARPARLAAHLGNREIDAFGEQVVHAEASPLHVDARAIVEGFHAGFERLEGQALDRAAEARLVRGLAGFVIRPGHGGRTERGSRHVR